MSTAINATGLAPPRWDGRRILFEVDHGGQSVVCAISLTALQDLSSFRRFKPAELLKCFIETRARIEAIALAKLRARPGAVAGVLNIWSDDLDEPMLSTRAKPPAAN